MRGQILHMTTQIKRVKRCKRHAASARSKNRFHVGGGGPLDG
jgi:hypothetical protein